jgi:hypothetical protein
MTVRRIPIIAVGSQAARSVDAFALPPTIPQKKRRRVSSTAEKSYCVYFMEILAGGLVKIGRSGNVAKRMTEVAGGLGLTQDDVKLAGRVNVSREHSVMLETALHRHFKERRVDGEWFDIYDKNLMHEVISVADRTIGSSYSIQGLAHDETYDENRDEWYLKKREASKLRMHRRRRW